jgi:hypothetical protein
VAPIILPAESDGDGDAVGLSAEIGQRLCRTAEGRLLAWSIASHDSRRFCTL